MRMRVLRRPFEVLNGKNIKKIKSLNDFLNAFY